jgi:hypothetical protein
VISHGNSITEPCFLGGLLEILRQDLSGLVEIIAFANVDEDIGFGAFVFLDEFSGIMLRPFGLVILPKVARKRLASKLLTKFGVGNGNLFTPGAIHGVGDGGEGADTFILSWVAQKQSQCSVTACPSA